MYLRLETTAETVMKYSFLSAFTLRKMQQKKVVKRSILQWIQHAFSFPMCNSGLT